MSAPEFLARRRSVRAFTAEPVSPLLIEDLLESACLAPAPHHSQPWRFVVVGSDGAKAALADAMAQRWREDLEHDGIPDERITGLTDASRSRLRSAPVLVLGCVTDDGLDHYPDATRQAAEAGMALLSLGAAVQNLMLAATEAGLASCWVAAPIFCPGEARRALDLPLDWAPRALVMVGHPDPAYTPRRRDVADLGRLGARR